jgi:hypothetical protein
MCESGARAPLRLFNFPREARCDHLSPITSLAVEFVHLRSAYLKEMLASISTDLPQVILELIMQYAFQFCDSMYSQTQACRDFTMRFSATEFLALLPHILCGFENDVANDMLMLSTKTMHANECYRMIRKHASAPGRRWIARREYQPHHITYVRCKHAKQYAHQQAKWLHVQDWHENVNDTDDIDVVCGTCNTKWDASSVGRVVG